MSKRASACKAMQQIYRLAGRNVISDSETDEVSGTENVSDHDTPDQEASEGECGSGDNLVAASDNDESSISSDLQSEIPVHDLSCSS